MNHHELETKFSSRIVESDQHLRLSALVSISKTLDSIHPLPVRILDNSTSGENWQISLIMMSIRTWIWGQSAPTFRFTRWVEIQDQIEHEYARTPEIVDLPVQAWHGINSELCRLLYLQECRAARYHLEDLGYDLRPDPDRLEGLDYSDPTSSSTSSPASALGRLGGRARTQAKANAARSNGKRGGRPKQDRDTSAFD